MERARTLWQNIHSATIQLSYAGARQVEPQTQSLSSLVAAIRKNRYQRDSMRGKYQLGWRALVWIRASMEHIHSDERKQR